MRVVCSKCGELFESLIIDKELAWKDVSDKSTKHVRKKHPKDFEAAAMAIQVVSLNVATVLHCLEFLVIPEEEEYIQAKLDAAIETVMIAVGFDPEEENEEGEPNTIDSDTDSSGSVDKPNVDSVELVESDSVGDSD